MICSHDEASLSPSRGDVGYRRGRDRFHKLFNATNANF
jgi:hypothetical protein